MDICTNIKNNKLLFILKLPENLQYLITELALFAKIINDNNKYSKRAQSIISFLNKNNLTYWNDNNRIIWDGLSHYIIAQNNVYYDVLSELKKGHKTSHWIWYIFPQIDGLIPNPSSINKKYAIKSQMEARMYILNKTLRNRYLECNILVLNALNSGKSLDDIFEHDSVKYISSITLFNAVNKYDTQLKNILQKIIKYIGTDDKTLKIIGKSENLDKVYPVEIKKYWGNKSALLNSDSKLYVYE